MMPRLIHDREIVLFDGTKLLGGDRYSEAKRHAGLNHEQMAQKFVTMLNIICFSMYNM